ncbi:response regulator transcription factor [Ornithinimicrobium cryptoxanthini]|uniref:response regulator transcription factor n=1 Tax=Ornithinimicrobium cryptoxanthini TaxID=2934161 RepID=UPI0021186372|nr:response regulator transcription factor [Ornithinimicrobium cryptoxanthini]
MTRVLIVEDDPMVFSFLRKGLAAQGLESVVETSAAEAVRSGLVLDIDVVLLDIRLEDGDGLQVLRALRSKGSTVPVIVLTGTGDQDVVTCLENGADDFMRKPFEFSELLARIRTRLRTERRVGELVVGPLSLDLHTRTVVSGQRRIELTSREFAVLELLMRNPGEAVSRTRLLDEVWGLTFDPGTNLVNVYINTLRKKLGADVVETVRGVGYRLPAPAARAPGAATASG